MADVIKLWVVGIMFEWGNRWEATVGVALTRTAGREVLKEWKDRVSSAKFRLVKYGRTL